jgi:hypothetical protein
MGLTISKAIAEAHGGSISVVSQVGSVFTLHLPEGRREFIGNDVSHNAGVVIDVNMWLNTKRSLLARLQFLVLAIVATLGTSCSHTTSYVCPRYVDNPHCFEVESGENLCRRLREIGKPVLNVEFEGRQSGYRLARIEGYPIEFNGGWKSSGRDSAAMCPEH